MSFFDITIHPPLDKTTYDIDDHFSITLLVFTIILYSADKFKSAK